MSKDRRRQRPPGTELLTDRSARATALDAVDKRVEAKATSAALIAPGIKAVNILVLLALAHLLYPDEVRDRMRAEDAPTQAAICRRTGYKKSSVSGSLGRLERNLKLVSEYSPVNYGERLRSWWATTFYALTETGEELLDHLFPPTTTPPPLASEQPGI